MKKLIKATSLLTSVSLLEMLLRFIRTKFIAVLLGATGTGLLSQLGIFLETLRSYGTIGTRRAVIRQIAEAKEGGAGRLSYGEAINTSFFLVLLASGLVSMVSVIFSVSISKGIFGDPSFYLYIIAIALIIPVACVSSLIAAIIKGNLDYTGFAKCSIWAYSLIILITPVSVYFFKQWGAILTYFLFFAFPMVGFFILNLKKRFIYFSKKINLKIMIEQFHDGFNNIYGEALSGTLKLIVTSWITSKLGLSEMGIYQVVITFTSVYLIILIQSITGYTLPAIASSVNDHEANEAVNDTLRFLVFILSPVILSLILIPEVFIKLLYSRDFLPAIPILRIQLGGTFFVVLAASFSTFLVAKGKMKALYVSATIYPLAYFTLSWLLFGPLKLRGVAIAYSIASFAAAVSNYILTKQNFALKVKRENWVLMGVTFGWIVVSIAAVWFTEQWVVKVALLAFGVPWFFISSRLEERRVLWDKFRSVFAR